MVPFRQVDKNELLRISPTKVDKNGVMWELIRYHVGTFLILMVSMVSCGNLFDTMWEHFWYLWCPWCHVGTIMILGGNICDTYGVLGGPWPSKTIGTLNFSFLLKNRLIQKKKFAKIGQLRSVWSVTNKSGQEWAFENLTNKSGQEWCHVGTYSIPCGNISDTYGVHGVMWELLWYKVGTFAILMVS